jgi:uncharacterized protein (TIGR03435 family)
MLRTLHSERFGLKVHHEQRELAVYQLTLMKNRPKFHESTTEGPAVFREERNGLVAERASISDLAMQISQPLDRPVIDKTGLNGHYDIRVDITPSLTPPNCEQCRRRRKAAGRFGSCQPPFYGISGATWREPGSRKRYHRSAGSGLRQ